MGGDFEGIEALAVVVLVPVVAAQNVAGDAEDIGSKTGFSAEALSPLDAGQEGALNEIVDVVGDLVGEKTTDAVEVSIEKLVASGLVTSAPAFE